MTQNKHARYGFEAEDVLALVKLNWEDRVLLPDGDVEDLPVPDLRTWGIKAQDGCFALKPIADHRTGFMLRRSAFSNLATRLGAPTEFVRDNLIEPLQVRWRRDDSMQHRLSVRRRAEFLDSYSIRTLGQLGPVRA